MPENLQNNQWFQLVLVLIFAGAIVYGGWNLWPNTVQMEKRNKQLTDENTKLQKEVNEGHELEARLPELEREIKAKQAELDALKKNIPSTEEAQDLIRKLERMAQETNINVQSWQSQPKQTQEFYYEWPIAITASGSYHSLGKFFSKISSYARIINVQNVKLTENRDNDPVQTVQASFSAVTYVYKE